MRFIHFLFLRKRQPQQQQRRRPQRRLNRMNQLHLLQKPLKSKIQNPEKAKPSLTKLSIYGLYSSVNPLELTVDHRMMGMVMSSYFQIRQGLWE